MKPKNKIVRLRNKYPLMSNAEIGREIGVSRVYVYNILKKNDLITNVPRKNKVKYWFLKIIIIYNNDCIYLFITTSKY